MEKLYYSISEVSEILNEEQHILRYWEKEFPQLKPKKNRGGNRSYSKNDLSILKGIKRLIREDKLTISEARQKIDKIIEKKQLKKNNSILLNSKTNKNIIVSNDIEETALTQKNAIDTALLKHIHSELSDILNILKSI